MMTELMKLLEDTAYDDRVDEDIEDTAYDDSVFYDEALPMIN